MTTTADLTKRIETAVSDAMRTGDWSFVEGIRSVFSESTDKISVGLLQRLMIEEDHARVTRGALAIAKLVEHDKSLQRDFLTVLKWTEKGISAAAKAATSPSFGRAGAASRWLSAANSVVHRKAISKAKSMVAVGNDRERIIEVVKKEISVKGLTDTQLVRMLRNNNALPAARIKKKKNKDG